MLDKRPNQAEKVESESVEAEAHEYERSAYILYYNKGAMTEKRISKWKNIRMRLLSEVVRASKVCDVGGEEIPDVVRPLCE